MSPGLQKCELCTTEGGRQKRPAVLGADVRSPVGLPKTTPRQEGKEGAFAKQ